MFINAYRNVYLGAMLWFLEHYHGYISILNDDSALCC